MLPSRFHQVPIHVHVQLPSPQQQNNEQSHLDHHSMITMKLSIKNTMIILYIFYFSNTRAFTNEKKI